MELVWFFFYWKLLKVFVDAYQKILGKVVARVYLMYADDTRVMRIREFFILYLCCFHISLESVKKLY